MTGPQESLDWPVVVLGVVGTGGAVAVLLQGRWLLAAGIFLASVVVELLLVWARRRRASVNRPPRPSGEVGRAARPSGGAG